MEPTPCPPAKARRLEVWNPAKPRPASRRRRRGIRPHRGARTSLRLFRPPHVVCSKNGNNGAKSPQTAVKLNTSGVPPWRPGGQGVSCRQTWLQQLEERRDGVSPPPPPDMRALISPSPQQNIWSGGPLKASAGRPSPAGTRGQPQRTGISSRRCFKLDALNDQVPASGRARTRPAVMPPQGKRSQRSAEQAAARPTTPAGRPGATAPGGAGRGNRSPCSWSRTPGRRRGPRTRPSAAASQVTRRSVGEGERPGASVELSRSPPRRSSAHRSSPKARFISAAHRCRRRRAERGAPCARLEQRPLFTAEVVTTSPARCGAGASDSNVEPGLLQVHQPQSRVFAPGRSSGPPGGGPGRSRWWRTEASTVLGHQRLRALKSKSPPPPPGQLGPGQHRASRAGSGCRSLARPYRGACCARSHVEGCRGARTPRRVGGSLKRLATYVSLPPETRVHPSSLGLRR